MANRWPACAVLAALLLTSCASEDTPPTRPPVPTSLSPTSPSVSATPGPTQTAPAPSPAPTRSARPVTFNPASAMGVVRHLAGVIGPREATSAAYREAADYVAERLDSLGYQVGNVEVRVPAGNSWGIDVPAGISLNVIADPPGFDPALPHVIIGAHLDTVPQAPGAEDNASGIGVMLELARMAALQPTPLPVRFVAFGAEEPRGEGDDLHHFGSQQYVADMPAAPRRALRAMVSLDRVGVPTSRVPVCTGGRGVTTVRDALAAAAAAIGVPVEICDNRASDHWSFEKANLPSARLGSVPYAGYHSPDDVPSVVEAEQLDRVGRIVWTWLNRP